MRSKQSNTLVKNINSFSLLHKFHSVYKKLFYSRCWIITVIRQVKFASLYKSAEMLGVHENIHCSYCCFCFMYHLLRVISFWVGFIALTKHVDLALGVSREELLLYVTHISDAHTVVTERRRWCQYSRLEWKSRNESPWKSRDLFLQFRNQKTSKEISRKKSFLSGSNHAFATRCLNILLLKQIHRFFSTRRLVFIYFSINMVGIIIITMNSQVGQITLISSSGGRRSLEWESRKCQS